MSRGGPRGAIYRCPVCGAEIGVIARRAGVFAPRCCNVDMVPVARRLVFYVCPVCGSEVALALERGAGFAPRCCSRPMLREAA